MFTPGQRCTSCKDPLSRAEGVAKIMFNWEHDTELICKKCWTEFIVNAYFGTTLRHEIHRAVSAIPFTLESELLK